jgi:hypothetical protein
MAKAETLALARTMLRAARQFSDYNFRECVPSASRRGVPLPAQRCCACLAGATTLARDEGCVLRACARVR